MILRPKLAEVSTCGYFLGRMLLALGVSMAVPLFVALAAGETNPAMDFCVGIESAVLAGLLLTVLCGRSRDLSWMQGMVVVALAWILAMIFGAIPLYLSGHFGSFLDACFEAMSGFATTGLSLAQDLDHLSLSHNLWRHLTMFIGGQGIAIIGLSLFVKGMAGGFKMYVGEGRDERVLPNVLHTARFIWLVSFVFLLLGTLALAVAGMRCGQRPALAFFHGACLFMAAFDTGGFAPQSQSVLYYHSLGMELTTAVIMILGALNFRLHYKVWTGDRRELWRNIETVAFGISVLFLAAVVTAGLRMDQTYSATGLLFRKGFYQLLSGHTGTGFSTVYSPQFVHEWGDLALVGLVGAMALGGGLCSTTGAIKMLRIGVLVKAFKQDIKRILLSEHAIFAERIHHIKDVFLEDKMVRAAGIITIAYLCLYAAGALAGMLCGYPFLASLFESTSAAANVGLSMGITEPGMPAALKLTYILQMWAGRLEFMAVFTLLGVVWAFLRGK